MNSGGTIYFPKGTYRITAAINLENKPVRVVGDGNGSVILLDPADGTNPNAFNLKYDFGGPDADKYYAFSDISILAAIGKSTNGSAIRLEYTGASGVVGVGNSLVLNNVNLGSVFAPDALTGWFRRGLYLVNCSGVVGNNVNIFTNARDPVEYGTTNSAAIEIINTKDGHNMIRTLSLTNIYLQRYHTALKCKITGTGSNIESIYLSQGEILAAKGFTLEAGHAVYLSGLHMDVRDYAFSSDGGGGNTCRIVGCDIRSQRTEPGNDSTNDYLIKTRSDNVTIVGNLLYSFKPTAGVIRIGGGGSDPENIVIANNFISGNFQPTYHAINCDVGSTNVTFGGNQLSQFGGNNAPFLDQTGGELFIYGQRAGNS